MKVLYYSSVSSCTYPVGWSILHNSNNRDTCNGVIWGYFWDSLNNWTIWNEIKNTTDKWNENWSVVWLNKYTCLVSFLATPRLKTSGF